MERIIASSIGGIMTALAGTSYAVLLVNLDDSRVILRETDVNIRTNGVSILKLQLLRWTS